MIKMPKTRPVDYLLKYAKDRDLYSNPYIIGTLIYKTLENFLNTMIRASIHNSELVQERFDEISMGVINAIYSKYILKLDPTSQYHIQSLSKLDPELFDHSLSLITEYYQRFEEYEKCAVIYKIHSTLSKYREKMEKIPVNS